MNEETGWCIALTVLSFILGLILAYNLVMNDSYKNAIEYGCGEYNKSTGEFNWIPKETK